MRIAKIVRESSNNAFRHPHAIANAALRRSLTPLQAIRNASIALSRRTGVSPVAPPIKTVDRVFDLRPQLGKQDYALLRPGGN
jgi:hypothetical protein